MKGFTLLTLSVAFFSASGCATQKAKLNEAMSLGVDHFRGAIEVIDDPMEATVVISTVNGWSEKHGLLGIVWSDSFLRGFIDKRTGKKTYQCYVVIRHTAGAWLSPYQANYGKPLRTTPIVKVGNDVDCSVREIYNSCKYEEHIVFPVDPMELSRIRAQVTPADFSSKIWQFRVKTQSGQDYNDGILLPEMLAFIAAMESYQSIPTQR